MVKKRLATGFMAFALAGFMASCFTRALWDNTDPHERVWMSVESVTPAQLDRKHVKYERYDGSFGKGYLVDKSAIRKFQDYTFRAVGTPVTVVLDAAVVVTVIGVLILAEDMKQNPEGWNRALHHY